MSPLVESATHTEYSYKYLSLPPLVFHNYFFRPFFARLDARVDARVDDLEEEPRPLRLLLLPLVLVLVLVLLVLVLVLVLLVLLELERELLDAPPSSSTCSPTASSIFITALLCAARSSSSFPNDCFSFALFSSLF